MQHTKPIIIKISHKKIVQFYQLKTHPIPIAHEPNHNNGNGNGNSNRNGNGNGNEYGSTLKIGTIYLEQLYQVVNQFLLHLQVVQDKKNKDGAELGNAYGHFFDVMIKFQGVWRNIMELAGNGDTSDDIILDDLKITSSIIPSYTSTLKSPLSPIPPPTTPTPTLQLTLTIPLQPQLVYLQTCQTRIKNCLEQEHIINQKISRNFSLIENQNIDDVIDLAFFYAEPLQKQDKASKQYTIVSDQQVSFLSETHRIQKKIKEIQLNRSANIQVKVATVPNIHKALSKGTKILHFSCHGHLNSLSIESPDRINLGIEKDLSSQQLIDILNQYKKLPEIIIFNACYSDIIGGKIYKYYSELGKYITVVGYHAAIDDQVCVEFAEEFYENIFNGCNISYALSHTKNTKHEQFRLFHNQSQDLHIPFKPTRITEPNKHIEVKNKTDAYSSIHYHSYPISYIIRFFKQCFQDRNDQKSIVFLTGSEKEVGKSFFIWKVMGYLWQRGYVGGYRVVNLRDAKNNRQVGNVIEFLEKFQRQVIQDYPFATPFSSQTLVQLDTQSQNIVIIDHCDDILIYHADQFMQVIQKLICKYQQKFKKIILVTSSGFKDLNFNPNFIYFNLDKKYAEQRKKNKRKVAKVKNKDQDSLLKVNKDLFIGEMYFVTCWKVLDCFFDYSRSMNESHHSIQTLNFDPLTQLPSISLDIDASTATNLGINIPQWYDMVNVFNYITKQREKQRQICSKQGQKRKQNQMLQQKQEQVITLNNRQVFIQNKDQYLKNLFENFEHAFKHIQKDFLPIKELNKDKKQKLENKSTQCQQKKKSEQKVEQQKESTTKPRSLPQKFHLLFQKLSLMLSLQHIYHITLKSPIGQLPPIVPTLSTQPSQHSRQSHSEPSNAATPNVSIILSNVHLILNIFEKIKRMFRRVVQNQNVDLRSFNIYGEQTIDRAGNQGEAESQSEDMLVQDKEREVQAIKMCYEVLQVKIYFFMHKLYSYLSQPYHKALNPQQRPQPHKIQNPNNPYTEIMEILQKKIHKQLKITPSYTNNNMLNSMGKALKNSQKLWGSYNDIDIRKLFIVYQRYSGMGEVGDFYGSQSVKEYRNIVMEMTDKVQSMQGTYSQPCPPSPVLVTSLQPQILSLPLLPLLQQKLNGLKQWASSYIQQDRYKLNEYEYEEEKVYNQTQINDQQQSNANQNRRGINKCRYRESQFIGELLDVWQGVHMFGFLDRWMASIIGQDQGNETTQDRGLYTDYSCGFFGLISYYQIYIYVLFELEKMKLLFYRQIFTYNSKQNPSSQQQIPGSTSQHIINPTIPNNKQSTSITKSSLSHGGQQYQQASQSPSPPNKLQALSLLSSLYSKSLKIGNPQLAQQIVSYVNSTFNLFIVLVEEPMNKVYRYEQELVKMLGRVYRTLGKEVWGRVQGLGIDHRNGDDQSQSKHKGKQVDIINNNKKNQKIGKKQGIQKNQKHENSQINTIYNHICNKTSFNLLNMHRNPSINRSTSLSSPTHTSPTICSQNFNQHSNSNPKLIDLSMNNQTKMNSLLSLQSLNSYQPSNQSNLLSIPVPVCLYVLDCKDIEEFIKRKRRKDHTESFHSIENQLFINLQSYRDPEQPIRPLRIRIPPKSSNSRFLPPTIFSPNTPSAISTTFTSTSTPQFLQSLSINSHVSIFFGNKMWNLKNLLQEQNQHKIDIKKKCNASIFIDIQKLYHGEGCNHNGFESVEIMCTKQRLKNLEDYIKRVMHEMLTSLVAKDIVTRFYEKFCETMFDDSESQNNNEEISNKSIFGSIYGRDLQKKEVKNLLAKKTYKKHTTAFSQLQKSFTIAKQYTKILTLTKYSSFFTNPSHLNNLKQLFQPPSANIHSSTLIPQLFCLQIYNKQLHNMKPVTLKATTTVFDGDWEEMMGCVGVGTKLLKKTKNHWLYQIDRGVDVGYCKEMQMVLCEVLKYYTYIKKASKQNNILIDSSRILSRTSTPKPIRPPKPTPKNLYMILVCKLQQQESFLPSLLSKLKLINLAYQDSVGMADETGIVTGNGNGNSTGNSGSDVGASRRLEIRWVSSKIIDKIERDMEFRRVMEGLMKNNNNANIYASNYSQMAANNSNANSKISSNPPPTQLFTSFPTTKTINCPPPPQLQMDSNTNITQNSKSNSNKGKTPENKLITPKSNNPPTDQELDRPITRSITLSKKKNANVNSSSHRNLFSNDLNVSSIVTSMSGVVMQGFGGTPLSTIRQAAPNINSDSNTSPNPTNINPTITNNNPPTPAISQQPLFSSVISNSSSQSGFNDRSRIGEGRSRRDSRNYPRTNLNRYTSNISQSNMSNYDRSRRASQSNSVIQQNLQFSQTRTQHHLKLPPRNLLDIMDLTDKSVTDPETRIRKYIEIVEGHGKGLGRIDYEGPNREAWELGLGCDVRTRVVVFVVGKDIKIVDELERMRESKESGEIEKTTRGKEWQLLSQLRQPKAFSFKNTQNMRKEQQKPESSQLKYPKHIQFKLKKTSPETFVQILCYRYLTKKLISHPSQHQPRLNPPSTPSSKHKPVPKSREQKMIEKLAQNLQQFLAINMDQTDDTGEDKRKGWREKLDKVYKEFIDLSNVG